MSANNTMEAQLSINYDQVGDILYLGTITPYPEQETEELEYGIVARLNPRSGEIENLEILFFSSRLNNDDGLQLPILAKFYLENHPTVKSQHEGVFA